MVLRENMLLMFHLWKRNKDPSSYVWKTTAPQICSKLIYRTAKSDD